MWGKDLRTLLFWYIYTLEYWDCFLDTVLEIDTPFIDSIDSIFLEYENGKVDLTLVSHLLGIYRTNRAKYEDNTKKYLNNWNKTYLLVKCLLYTYILEQNYYQQNNKSEFLNEESKKSVVSKYLRLCDQYIDNNSVSAIHAVLLKLVEL